MQIKIDKPVNARLKTEPEPQWATVTIVVRCIPSHKRGVASSHLQPVTPRACTPPCLTKYACHALETRHGHACTAGCQETKILPDSVLALSQQGINDTPEPRYIRNMQAIIGAVCGAATAVPCALLTARFIQSLRRGKMKADTAMDDDDDDDDAGKGDDGGFQ